MCATSPGAHKLHRGAAYKINLSDMIGNHVGNISYKFFYIGGVIFTPRFVVLQLTYSKIFKHGDTAAIQSFAHNSSSMTFGGIV